MRITPNQGKDFLLPTQHETPTKARDAIKQLILSRNISQTIVINGDIRVTVLSVAGNQVRIGIDAPRDVIVDREEIHERRMAEKGSGNY